MSESSQSPVEERGRKRKITEPEGQTGSQTPTLLAPRRRLHHEDDNVEPPAKRLRGDRMAVAMPLPNLPTADATDPQLQSDFLRIVPEEVVGHVLSFLGGVEDRHALQCTCVQFNRISNTDAMLKHVELGGETETGKNGIIQEEDTPATAAASLTPFARAGNLEAIYM